MSRDEKFDVDILYIQEVVTYPRPNEKAVTRLITYKCDDLPPRTISIPIEEDTPENRSKLIREDIIKAKSFRSTKIRV